MDELRAERNRLRLHIVILDNISRRQCHRLPLLLPHMHEYTSADRPQSTFQLIQDGKHVSFWEPVTKFAVNRTIEPMVTQHDSNQEPPSYDEDMES